MEKGQSNMSRHENFTIDHIFYWLSEYPKVCEYDVYLPDGRICQVVAHNHLHAAIGVIYDYIKNGKSITNHGMYGGEKAKLEVVAYMPDGQSVKSLIDSDLVRIILEAVKCMIDSNQPMLVQSFGITGWKLS